MFSNTYTFLYLYVLSHLFSSWNNIPPHLHAAHFFPFSNAPWPHFLKPHLQSKTFLNIRAVPISTVFCSNAVLITTPNYSMHFFSFFDVLPSAPTITGMTLMLLMFHIILVSLFSSWYPQFFPSLFH